MSPLIQEQYFKFEGGTYTKVYDSKDKRYKFFRNGKEVDVYQWNRVVNRYHPMSHKATHPNIVIRWIERHRWFLTRHHIAADGSKFILDIGCESGNIASALVSHRHRVILVDVDQEMLASTRSQTKHFPVICLAADIYKVPFKDNSIDRVMCTEVLEHLIVPERAVREIGRILKPGGKVVVSVPNDRLILWMKQQLIRMGLRQALGNLSPGLAMGHLHIFNKATLSTLFDKNLKVVHCFYNSPWFTNIFLVAEKR